MSRQGADRGRGSGRRDGRDEGRHGAGGDDHGFSGGGHEGHGAQGDPFRDPARMGGDWAGLRPRFDDPMTWSLPCGRIAGINVRVHLLFVVFIAVELLKAAFAAPTTGQGATLGPAPALLLLACLFWSVLLHEFGHCVACRWCEGSADEILMWPLGGLAACRPPDRWSAHLATAIGGPFVTFCILAIAAPVLGAVTGRWIGVAFPSPLHLGGLAVVEHSWWTMALYMLVWTNMVLLLFNLLPLFPLDGGRILQAGLWPRVGYAPSMRWAVRAGYIGAILLGILGLVNDETLLVLVAVFGGVVCWQTLTRLDYTQQALGFEPGPDGSLRPAPDPDVEAREAARRVREEEAALLDGILRKIAEVGIGSLSSKERRILREATERRRGGEGRG